jgi:hypothetical protein
MDMAGRRSYLMISCGVMGIMYWFQCANAIKIGVVIGLSLWNTCVFQKTTSPRSVCPEFRSVAWRARVDVVGSACPFWSRVVCAPLS